MTTTTHRSSSKLRVEPLEDRYMMAFDAFLKIEGVDGESSGKGTKGAIEVLSWSWGATNPSAAFDTPGGDVTSPNSFSFVKLQDKATPQLLLKATGEHIKKAVLTTRAAFTGSDSTGQPVQRYHQWRWTFSDVVISSFRGAGQGTTMPAESISFNFDSLVVTFKSSHAGGGGGGAGKVSFQDLNFNATGPDLNGDGSADPLFFAYAKVGDFNEDLVPDMFVPGDGDGDGKMDNPPLIDLNGDRIRDDSPPGFDGSDSDQEPDVVVRADFNGDRQIDFVCPGDTDNGRVDPFILADLDGDGKADLVMVVAGYDLALNKKV